MAWGSQYWGGEQWGLGAPSSYAYLFYFLREAPNVRAIAGIIDTLYVRTLGVLFQAGSRLTLDSGKGEALDIVGSWLLEYRGGLDDSRFRKALKTMIAAVFDSPGTADALIDTWVAWAETTPTYETLPPAQVRMTGVVADEDRVFLRTLLELARPAGVQVSIAAAASAPLLVDDSTNPLTSPGVVDCAASPVTGAAVVASEV